MDFREIQYIRAIAQYQNITKAADSLFVSQPTLSKFLISLEKKLNVKLFRKSGQKYYLTYAGERYLEKANQILQLKRDLDAELSDIRKNEMGSLNIAYAPMRCSYLLPATLPEFYKSYPNVDIRIFNGNSQLIDQKLIDGTIEVGFYSQPPHPNPLLDYRLIGTEELLLCISSRNPLCSCAHPTPNSRFPYLDPVLFHNELLLKLPSHNRTGQFIDHVMANQNIQFHKTMDLENIPAILGLVASGYGISMLFEPHLQQVSNAKDICCFSFHSEPVTSCFVAAYRKNSYLSSFARSYIAETDRAYHLIQEKTNAD